MFSGQILGLMRHVIQEHLIVSDETLLQLVWQPLFKKYASKPDEKQICTSPCLLIRICLFLLWDMYL